MQSHKDHRHHTAACFNNMGTAFDSDVFSVYIIQCAMAAAAIAVIVVVDIFSSFCLSFSPPSICLTCSASCQRESENITIRRYTVQMIANTS